MEMWWFYFQIWHCWLTHQKTAIGHILGALSSPYSHLRVCLFEYKGPGGDSAIVRVVFVCALCVYYNPTVKQRYDGLQGLNWIGLNESGHKMTMNKCYYFHSSAGCSVWSRIEANFMVFACKGMIPVVYRARCCYCCKGRGCMRNWVVKLMFDYPGNVRFFYCALLMVVLLGDDNLMRCECCECECEKNMLRQFNWDLHGRNQQ